MPFGKKSKTGAHLAKLNQVHPKRLKQDEGSIQRPRNGAVSTRE
eukprot:CAMPEP_0119071394 /NCGR_PEP_ID=MMETSP1178-20130426/49675_1 /TAXON_ID=33656 /ORGANISM="unid sp, Strain CCMP2000" /LENGTH=43 /DNA_ID= /DNA_START= /DNA_END= /DNA_ORIENTATION=